MQAFLLSCGSRVKKKHFILEDPWDEIIGYIATLIHHQGIICGVAFVRSSLRRIGQYASVVAPRRLASNALLVIRNPSKCESRFGCWN
jgi:hypothetical protein